MTQTPDDNQNADSDMPVKNDKPHIDVTQQQDGSTIDLHGRWVVHTVGAVDEQMRTLEEQAGHAVTIDLKNVEAMDTAGAWEIARLAVHLEQAAEGQVQVTNVRKEWRALLEQVSNAARNDHGVKKVKRRNFKQFVFGSLGRNVMSSLHDVHTAMYILGATLIGPQKKQGRKSSISIPAITSQIDKMGVGAIPIIVLMSVIVGAIIAQQGAFQLKKFGADIFVVDLVGILVFRELGVLLSAIMIAGRSGSAITAEIGSMKMREETDALTVIGLNPVGVLVFPRLVALTIILPLLTILADLSAVIGALFVSMVYSGITFDAFMQRLDDAVWMSTFMVGLIKAPFMAMVIGVIAAVEGLKVGGSAESLGQRVTSSVVKSIFIVIVMDGLFAMFFAAIDF